MANYSYLRNLARSLSAEEFEQRLVEAVEECFGDRLAICRCDNCNEGESSWSIWAPGTSVPDVFRPGGPYRVGVSLTKSGRCVEFRHGLSLWHTWVQGSVAEHLSESLNVGRYFDVDDRVEPPGTRKCRAARTFWQYMSSGYSRPLSDEDRADILRMMRSPLFGGPREWEPSQEELI